MLVLVLVEPGLVLVLVEPGLVLVEPVLVLVEPVLVLVEPVLVKPVLVFAYLPSVSLQTIRQRVLSLQLLVNP
jgi:hypothetical protein